MGTSALSVALLAVGEGTSFAGATQVAARVVLVIALVMGVLVLGATAARWVRFRTEALADLRHPVKGGMTATAAGALLTLAVAIGRVGPGFLPESIILPAVTVLAVVGALLALVIGWEFLAEMFTSPGRGAGADVRGMVRPARGHDHRPAGAAADHRREPG